MDWTIVQGGLYKRGPCSEWASGLSLAADKALAAVKKHGLDDCTRWTLQERGMFRVGNWAFPCC